MTGLFVAYGSLAALTGFFATGRRPMLLDVQFDWQVVLYAMGITLATGVLTGLWPAVRALRIRPQTAMKDNNVAWQRLGARRVLIAGQVALSLALIVAATLLARTMVNLRAVDRGFISNGVLTMSLDPALPRVADAATREQLWGHGSSGSEPCPAFDTPACR